MSYYSIERKSEQTPYSIKGFIIYYKGKDYVLNCLSIMDLNDKILNPEEHISYSALFRIGQLSYFSMKDGIIVDDSFPTDYVMAKNKEETFKTYERYCYSNIKLAYCKNEDLFYEVRVIKCEYEFPDNRGKLVLSF